MASIGINTDLDFSAPTSTTPAVGASKILKLVTASRAVVSNASGDLAASAVTATELGYLSGVTSSIQTQITAISAPFADTQTIIKGSADATKLLRFEVDGFTTGQTRVVTVPDANIVIAGSASALTSGRVPYATTGGLLTDSANATLDSSGQLAVGSTASGGSALLTVQGYSPNATNGSYGRVLFAANANYTGSARHYLITNAISLANFGIVRSVDATTAPTLSTLGAVTSGTLDFSISNTGAISMPGTVASGAITSTGQIYSATQFMVIEGGKIAFRYTSGDPGPYSWLQGGGLAPFEFHTTWTSTNATKIYSWFFNGGGGGESERAFFTNDARLAIITTDLNGQLNVQAKDAATRVSVFKGAASQSANLTEWQNSSGTVLASVNSAGSFSIGNNFDPFARSYGALVNTLVTSTGSPALVISGQAGARIEMGFGSTLTGALFADTNGLEIQASGARDFYFVTNGLTRWTITSGGDFSGTDGRNIIVGTTTGTKIGTSTSQKLGFWNATPVVRPSAYTPTNVTTDRAFDANSTTLDEVADVLGTLIADLKSIGLIG